MAIPACRLTWPGMPCLRSSAVLLEVPVCSHRRQWQRRPPTLITALQAAGSHLSTLKS